MLGELDARDVDLVLGPLHADLPAEYAAQPLAEDRLVLLTAPGHRLAQQPEVALADVRNEPFICLPAVSGLRGVLEAAAADAGFPPRVLLETSTPSSIRSLVSAGLGVALLAASAVRDPGAPVDVHEVRPALRHPPFGVIQHRGRRLAPAARTFRDHLAQAAPTTPRAPRAPAAAGRAGARGAAGPRGR